MNHLITALCAALLSIPVLAATPAQFLPRPNQVVGNEDQTFSLTVDTEITLVKVAPDENSVPPPAAAVAQDESYQLEITEEEIIITSASPAGIFYACQTLKQWLPDKVTLSGDLGENPQPMLKLSDDQAAQIPCVSISDGPRYPWRGFMLDSGRQYQSIDYIKRTLDILAAYKFNVFHWHLTEGHGWRIEIDAYPELTSVGSDVGPWSEQKGYYTKEQIRDIVAYAMERHITVVPEIDVPGHSNAALIAYPEYACFREAPSAERVRAPIIICGGREETYTFLNTILDEVCDLFPSKYIHIGGDEAVKDHWQKCPDCQAALQETGGKNMQDLQIHMMNRLADHLGEKGRKAICWGDVVTQSNEPLAANIAVMWWNFRSHQFDGLRKAVARGHECIMAPNYYTYLNFPVSSKLPDYTKARTFDLQMAYEQNPVHEADKLPAEQQELVLGINPCLWTDHHLTQDQLDERAYPRLLALAELNWHKGEREPFDQFSNRVQTQEPGLEALGVGSDSAVSALP